VVAKVAVVVVAAVRIPAFTGCWVLRQRRLHWVEHGAAQPHLQRRSLVWRAVDRFEAQLNLCAPDSRGLELVLAA
jgi:hypothetical protein